MFKQLQHYLTYGKYYVGVEHNEGELHVSVLKTSKDEINSDKQGKYSNIEDLVEFIPKQSPVVLVINNQHVLTKVVASANTNDSRMALKAFPNINLDDFYIEVLPEGSQNFVSICRKSYVDELLEQYKKAKLSIITFCLGNLSGAFLKDFIDETSFFTSNAEFSVDSNNCITKMTPKTLESTSQYNINGLKTSSNYLLSLAVALQTALKSPSTIVRNTEGKTRELWSNFKTARVITQTLQYGGVFILVLLLINVFIFNNYYHKANALEQTTSVNNTAKDRLLQLKSEVNRKKLMVDDVLRSQGSLVSLYANTILKLLPNAIVLKEFNYQPLQKRIKTDKPIALRTATIELAGETTSSETFSLWITQIEALVWVDKVLIIDYGAALNRKEAFKIKIHIQK